MLATTEKTAARPGWTESAPWMGCSLPALLRILAAGGWRVEAAYWPECLIDLLFAALNSSLGFVQDVLYRGALGKVQLPDNPVFIIGHWRTGTTLLHELLALDPRLRAPTNYECLVPNHFLLTSRWLKSWSSFTLPRARPSDPMQVTWDSPQEDEFALCNMGLPSPYATIAFPNERPQGDSYLELTALPAPQQREWEAALMLFFRRLVYAQAGRLVLKSPTHSFRLPTLLRLFPKARWINMVRNPFAVFSSTVRLWRSMYAAYGYQKPRFEQLEENVLKTFARLHERLESTRSLAPAGSLVDVRYEDLVREPVVTMQRLYEMLELGSFGTAQTSIERYLSQRASYVPGRHAIETQWADEIRTRWQAYFERFGYALDDGAVIGGSLITQT